MIYKVLALYIPGGFLARFLNHQLVGGFNPFEKYARQIGSFPQGGRGENSNNIWVATNLVNWSCSFQGTATPHSQVPPSHGFDVPAGWIDLKERGTDDSRLAMETRYGELPRFWSKINPMLHPWAMGIFT